MKKIIATAALACLFSGSALAVATPGAATSHAGAGNATTHSVAFNVNAAYHPLTFVDTVTDAGTLSTVAASAKALVVASEFDYASGHTYILSNRNVTGGNSGKLDIGFASNKTLPASLGANTSLVGTVTNGKAYVLVATNATGALTQGSTVVTYTVTDYTS